MESNALAFEYQRDYGTARGDFDISNAVNNPAANGVCSVFGLGLTEETSGILGLEVRVLRDYITYPALVTLDNIWRLLFVLPRILRQGGQDDSRNEG